MRLARGTAAGLGILVLAWQAGNAARGRFVHDFLVADLILAPVLVVASIARPDRRAAPILLAAYSAMGGVFLSATTMRLLRGGYDLGTTMATMGLILCAVWSTILMRSLTQSGGDT